MQAVEIDNAVMLHDFKSAGLKAFYSQVADARLFRSHRMDGLRKAIVVEDVEKEAEHLQWLLSSPHSVLASIIGVNARLPFDRRVTLERCQELASAINLSKPISESVRVYGVKKQDGGVRVISDFGIEHRTRQAIIGDVMRGYHKPQPWQFGMRGVHKAIEAVRDELTKGAAYVAHLDITDFFGSFDFDQLPTELPLPQEVVESAVLGRFMETDVGEDSGTSGCYSPCESVLHYKARQGLPTGSSSSPIIGDFVLSHLAWPKAELGTLVNLVDNFLLLAPSAPVLQERIAELHEAVEQLPGGQFKLHDIHVGASTKPFPFLGHQFTMGPQGLRIEASVANWERLVKALWQNDKTYCSTLYGLSGKDKNGAKVALARMYAFAEGWLQAFRMVSNIDEIREFAMGEIADRCKPLGLSLSTLAKTVDASMAYTPSGYDFET